jgi:hypothetical protein
VKAKRKNRAYTKEKQKEEGRKVPYELVPLALSSTSSQALSFTFTHNLQKAKLLECKELKEAPADSTWRA